MKGERRLFPFNKTDTMSRASLVFIFLFFPCFGFGFTEAEIDLLESAEEKDMASSPWRTQIDFALQRNLLLPSRLSHSQEQEQKDDEEKGSRLSDLLDPYSVG